MQFTGTQAVVSETYLDSVSFFFLTNCTDKHCHHMLNSIQSVHVRVFGQRNILRFNEKYTFAATQ